MNICHVYNMFYPVGAGGLERYVLELSNYLSNEIENLHFFLLTEHVIGLKKRETYGRLNVYRLGFNLPDSLIFELRKIGFHVNILDKLERANDKSIKARFAESSNLHFMKRVDIFHSHGLWAPYELELGFMLSKHFHKPLVVSLHGSLEGPEKMKITNEYIYILRNYARAILCNRESVLAKLKEIGLGDKSYFVPNFINTSSFTCPKNKLALKTSRGKNLLSIGRLTRLKDPITAVMAFNQVVKEEPDVTFHLVGYGPLWKEINRLVRRLKLQDKVILHGKQFNVQRFLWESDIFLATDLVDNIGLSVLEAMASSIAVVAYDAGETRSLIRHGENGILVPPKDSQALAKSILYLVRDENLRTKISADAVKTASQRDIRIIAPKIMNIYYDCSK